MEQIDNISKIAEKALESYRRISEVVGVEMHSFHSAKRRIQELQKGKLRFMQLSRDLSYKAQKREAVTVQPKEHLSGRKGRIIIQNYLGGCYYLTCDEVEIRGNHICLVEGKHTQRGILPSKGDIKDGLIKMILFTNLESAALGEQEYQVIPVLKLTSTRFKETSLDKSKASFLELLRKEASYNGFRIIINHTFVV